MYSSFAFVALLLNSVSSRYDIGTANKMCEYTLASYCIGNGGHGVPNWDCSACKKRPGMINITVIKTGFLDYNSHAFVGYDSVDKAIIVAFAGTDPLSLPDYIDDIGIAQIKYPLSSMCNCYVHKGFYDTYAAVRNNIWNATLHLRAIYGTLTPIRITGHSLGAALAAHCSLDGLLTHLIKPQYVYTYGQPRVGDEAFAVFYQQYINNDTQLHYRVTHRKDPVPHLPSETLNVTKTGYHHMSLEIFYKNHPNETYTICNGSGEDRNCSDRYDVDLDLEDHLDYMGFDFTTNFLFCKA